MSFIEILIRFLPVILELINESRNESSDTRTVISVMHRACTSVPEAVNMAFKIHDKALTLDADTTHPFRLEQPVAIQDLVGMLLSVGDRTRSEDSMAVIVALAGQDAREKIARVLAA